MFHVTTGIELHGRVIKKKKKVGKMGKLFSFNVHILCFLTQIVLVFTYLVQVKMTLLQVDGTITLLHCVIAHAGLREEGSISRNSIHGKKTV